MTNYRIEFDVHGNTLAEVEDRARTRLLAFAGEAMGEFTITIEARPAELRTDGEAVFWTAEVTAVKGGKYGPVAK